MALQTSGPISVEDIAVEFGGTAPHALSEYYGAASGIPASGAIAISDFYGASSSIPAPVGLIVPYTSASIPANWERFTSADDKFIVGAGSSYAAGATGGSDSTTFTGSTSTTGAHVYTSHPAVYNFSNSGGQVAPPRPTQSTNTAGNHAHTFSVPVSPSEDAYKNFVLIKCTSSSNLPQNSMLLGAASLSGLTNVENTTDRFLRSASSYGGTGGSGTLSGSASTGTAGSHTHGATSTGEWGAQSTIASGNHTHTASLSATLNTKRMYLSAWTNASAEFGLVENGIAMWESATPPSGWVICDGNNSTPDLRDYFVRIGTTANHGTSSGTNNVSWSIDASGNGPHNHQGPTKFYLKDDGPARIGTFAWPHSHSGSGTTSVVPPYYALYFIKYTG